MKNKLYTVIINFLKGLIIGIGKIIPGVSGAILAIILGVYDTSLYYLNNLKTKFKESVKYLLPLLVGIVLSIIIFSRIINYTLTNFYMPTMLFFTGLLIGESPSLYSKIKKKNYFIIIISFSIIMLLTLLNLNNNYLDNSFLKDFIIFFISGFIEALGTIIPGLSASSLLLLLGTYHIIIFSIGNPFVLESIKILLPFALGLLIGVILTIKIISYLLNKHNNKSYNAIYGIYLSSIIILVIKAFEKEYTTLDFILGLVLFVIGLVISTLFDKKEKNLKN